MQMFDFLSRRGRLANRARAESGWRAAGLWQQLVDQLDAARPGDRRLLEEARSALDTIARGQGKRDDAQAWHGRATGKAGPPAPTPPPRPADGTEDERARMETILAHDPEDVETLHALGVLLAKGGKAAEAENLFRRALDRDPKHVGTLGSLGVLHHQRGEDALAEDLFRRALGHDPDHINTLSNLGLLLENGGRTTEAEDLFRRALGRAPDHVNTLCNFGILLARGGKTSEAMKHWRRALDCDPDHVDILSNLGNLLAKEGNTAQAEELWRRALGHAPDHFNALCSLGDLRYRRGDIAQAEELWRRVLARAPNHTVTLRNIGVLQRDRGEWAKAIASFKKCLDVADPRNDAEHIERVRPILFGLLSEYHGAPDVVAEHADLLLDLGFTSRLEGAIDERSRITRNHAGGGLSADSNRLAAFWRDLALYRTGLARSEIEPGARSRWLKDKRLRHAAAEMAWQASDADPSDLARAGWIMTSSRIESDKPSLEDLALEATADPAWEVALVLELNQAVGQKVALQLYSVDEVMLERAAPDLLADYRRLRCDILGLHHQLRADAEPTEEEGISRIALRRDFDILRDKIARKVPTAAPMSEIRRRDLPDHLAKYSHRQPVAWLTSAEAGGVAVVLRDGEATMLRLPTLTRAAAAEWNGRLMAVRDLPLADYRSALDTVLTALSSWLWRSAMEALAGPLAGTAEAVIIPCGQLAALPWVAARDGQTWWIERDDLPALRFAACAEAAMAASDAMGTETADALALFAEPGSELAGLRTLWPDRFRMALSRDELLAAWQHPHHLVHLRCHGTADTNAPMNSTLTLPDGDITLLDLRRARHHGGAARQRLITMASCETAHAGTELPEEPQSFAATLLEAGAGAVVAPLLPVEAEATSTLMALLHKQYAGGHSPAHALRLAQRAVLATSSISASNPLRSPDPMQGAVRKKIVRATPPGPSAWALMQVYGG